MPTPLAAISLKLVGIIAIISSLVDFMTLLFPPQLGDISWQINTVTAIVDRGIIPLLGIVLMFTGYWIESNLGNVPRRGSLATDQRFWLCLLASFLGLMFLLSVVVHPNNVRRELSNTLSLLDTQAQQASEQAKGQLSQEASQSRAQFDALMKDESLLQAAVESGSLSEAQRAQIEEFKNNPEAFNDFLNSRINEAQSEMQTTIGARKTEITKRAKLNAWKSALRVGIGSLLLAIGYIFIGWSGLKRLLAMVR